MAKAAFNHERAWALRGQGLPWKDIGWMLGVSPNAAKKACQAIAGTGRVLSKPAKRQPAKPRTADPISIYTPWLSTCNVPEQRTDTGDLPARGSAHGHVHHSTRLRSPRGTTAGHQT